MFHGFALCFLLGIWLISYFKILCFLIITFCDFRCSIVLMFGFHLCWWTLVVWDWVLGLCSCLLTVLLFGCVVLDMGYVAYVMFGACGVCLFFGWVFCFRWFVCFSTAGLFVFSVCLLFI